MIDVQSFKDIRNIPIQKVGVKKVRLPMLIPEKSGGLQTVTAEIALCADLASDARGSHMSRFMEILNKYAKTPITKKTLKSLLEETRNSLKSNSSEIKIKFRYFIEKKAPISGKPGLIDYVCEFKAYLDQSFKTFFFIEIPVITLCPCSKEISEYGAHNQRAVIRINIEYGKDNVLWFEDLTHKIEELASGELYSVLKRSDEKAVTEKAYENPKFVEDIVRDAVLYLNTLDETASFDVECESIESIHNHNAFAYVNPGVKR